MTATKLVQTGMKLVGGGLIPLMLVLGLLAAPVTCTCGAAVPHGHSLFQLPHHNHAAMDHAEDDHPSELDHQEHESHPPHKPKIVNSTITHGVDADDDCDHPVPTSIIATGNFALSNAMEHQDGAVLKAPPASSFGQPTVMNQPAYSINLVAAACEAIELPATRILEGTDTPPETPPPRILISS